MIKLQGFAKLVMPISILLYYVQPIFVFNEILCLLYHMFSTQKVISQKWFIDRINVKINKNKTENLSCSQRDVISPNILVCFAVTVLLFDCNALIRFHFDNRDCRFTMLHKKYDTFHQRVGKSMGQVNTQIYNHGMHSLSRVYKIINYFV